MTTKSTAFRPPQFGRAAQAAPVQFPSQTSLGASISPHLPTHGFSDHGPDRTDDQYIRLSWQLPHVEGTKTPLSSVHCTSSDVGANHEPSLIRTPSSNKRPLWGSWGFWKYELFAVALCWIALGALLGTLLPHRDDPLPKWPFNITINTLVSIYSSVFKMALAYLLPQCVGQLQWLWFSATQRPRSLFDVVLYDSASRGVTGSLAWLGRNHVRQPLMTLAVLVIVAATVLDPFFQLLLQYTDCETLYDGPRPAAQISKTNYISQYGDFFLSLSASALVGSTGPSPAECPTGNCTFPEHVTMGYCSSCQDISDQIQTSCYLPPDPEDVWESMVLGKYLVDCDWNAPSSINFSVRSNVSSPYNRSDIDPALLTSLGWIDFWSTPKVPNITTGSVGTAPAGDQAMEILILQGRPAPKLLGKWPIPQFASNNLTCSPTNRNDWACRGYGAASCSLYPCVKALNASISNDLFVEQVVDQSTLDDILKPDIAIIDSLRGSGTPATFIDTHCLTQEQRASLNSIGISVSTYTSDPNTTAFQTYPENGKRWIWSNVQWNDTYPGYTAPKNATFPLSMMADGCIYLYDPSWALMDKTIPEAFSGLLSPGSYSVTEGVDVTYDSVSLSGPDGLAAFQDLVFSGRNMSFDLVQEGFDNISTLFTNYLRVNGNQNWTRPANGTAYHYAVCLRVDFKWIAFPVTLLVCTIVILISTIITTSRHTVPTWKTSPLAYIFHGQGAGDKKDRSKDSPEPAEIIPQLHPATLETIEDMEKRAKKISVQLLVPGSDEHLAYLGPEDIQAQDTGQVIQNAR